MISSRNSFNGLTSLLQKLGGIGGFLVPTKKNAEEYLSILLVLVLAFSIWEL